MQFIENGPNIPDELLIARDEGRVIFFCGSGVSKEAAYLPDFFKLAEMVINELGVESDSFTRELIDKLKPNQPDSDTQNTCEILKEFLTADRIFSFLEKDFDTSIIESYVAKSLKIDKPNLSIHNAVLKLAKTPDERTQLITTNFDRLFEMCNKDLNVLEPPHLPNLNKDKLLDGIIHLHGIVNDEFSGSNNGFTLSTSNFGEAYLVEAWATNFIKNLFDGFTVVFLGYSADDPPIHFLLEALKKKKGALKQVYAFSTESKSSRWSDRGVTPISFKAYGEHLWPTIFEWSQMADNKDAWLKNVLKLAQRSPAELSPLEREKVAYLVSSFSGAKKFTDLEPPPPADWLMVFDSKERYKQIKNYGTNTTSQNWEIYRLAIDPLPESIKENVTRPKQETPNDAWDAFSPTPQDLSGIAELEILHGFFDNSEFVPRRLLVLADWVGKISNQPLTLHWAIRQTTLAKKVIRQITLHLNNFKKEDLQSYLYLAWQYLFETLSETDCLKDNESSWYLLEEEAKTHGFSNRLIRKLCEQQKPRLSIHEPYMPFFKEQNEIHKIEKLSDLVNIELNYPQHHRDFEIENEFLSEYVHQMRLTLLDCVTLELETQGYFYPHIPTLFPSEEHTDAFERSYKISSIFFEYFNSFQKLLAYDLQSAIYESRSWSFNDSLFNRLNIWGSGRSDLFDNERLNNFFSKMNRDKFWDSSSERDLLMVLVKRWSDFNSDVKKYIESLLLQGREIDDLEDEKWQTFGILNRITYLTNNGCEFNTDISEVMIKLVKVAPEWNSNDADRVVEESHSGVYSVQTNTNYDALLKQPIEKLLELSRNERGRAEDDFRVENNPWFGLCENQPIRALKVLSLAIENHDYAKAEWNDFFSANESNSIPRFICLLGHKFSSFPEQFFIENIYPISRWFKTHSELLSSKFPTLFDALFQKFITVFSPPIELIKTGIVRTYHSKINWTGEAINSPVGIITEALFNDSNHRTFEQNWKNKIECLLTLTGENRCYVLNILGLRLNWFNHINESWSDKNLFPIFTTGNEDEQAAIRQAYFKYGGNPNIKFLEKITPVLLDQIRISVTNDYDYEAQLTAFLLLAWGTHKDNGKRILSSTQVREIILSSNSSFRERLLLKLKQWYSDSREGNRWQNETSTFFKEVWPKHKWIRSSKITEAICGILFKREENFEPLFKSTENFLSELNNQGHSTLFIYEMSKKEDSEPRKILKNHTKIVLKLLYKILPENSDIWPYETKNLINTLPEYDSSILTEKEYVDLVRRAHI